MRKRERENIINKTAGFSETSYGQPLYLRPFETDDKKIAEISRFSGERKHAIAQKLIHLALTGKNFKLAENNLEEKIDWLIKTERQNRSNDEATVERLDEICERLGDIETMLGPLSENARTSSRISLELYCMLSIAVSSLNQIFAKLLEFLSPIEVERSRSFDVANGAMANLISHSILDLEKCTAFHELGKCAEPFIGTKKAKLKERITSAASIKGEEGGQTS